jgi:hypothetical protein
MRTSWPQRVEHRSPSMTRRRGAPLRGATVAVIGIALIASALIAPVAAAGSPSTRTEAGQQSGRNVGGGVHVDARQAARESTKTPRIHRGLDRRSVDLGARPSSKAIKPTSTALSRTSDAVGDQAVVDQAVGDQARAGPTLVHKITTTFPGIAQSGTCSCEPPDPWLAVSPSFIVQSTNGKVRVSSRTGTTLLSMPIWALFAVPVDRGDSDPRIIWDAVRGRWVGVVVTYTGDFSHNGLRLAVSETADPTAGWIVYAIETGKFFPDYPGISSSSDKIVLTSDDFDLDAFAGPSVFVADWANVLAGTSLYVGVLRYGTAIAHFRPAQMLTSVPNVPVIYERADGHAGYLEITGAAHTRSGVNGRDLTAMFGSAAFATPPQPVQPGSVTISQAVDERPTDAVYRTGKLWYVATGDYFDGVRHWAQARYSRVSTAANGTAPTAAIDYATHRPAHYFMPGIGVSGNGTAFLTATLTDDARFPTTVVAEFQPGGTFVDYIAVEASTEAYTGVRWGDYVGVAADPSGSGAAWFGHELVAPDGGWRTSVARVVSDATAPTAPGVVTQVPVIPATLGGTVPIKVSWGAATDAGSGIKSYLVQRSDDGGGFFGVNTPGTTLTQALLVNHTFRYRVTAVDDAGNLGPTTYGPTFKPTLYQQTSSTVYTGTWGTTYNASYSGGSTRSASTAGRYATFTATLARSIAFVTTRASTRGSFRVYVDGV